MKILAIETSSQACSVAICNDKKITEKHQILNNQHSQFLLSFIDDLLAELSIEKSELDAVAVGNGPGSFTGLRLAMGVAQGLSYGLNKPLIPVSSLLAVAAQCINTNVIVAIDARMGEIYWQCLERQDELNYIELTPPSLNKPSDLLLPQIEGQWYGIGSGWDIYSNQLTDSLQCPGDYMPDILPKARVVAAYAHKLIEQDKMDSDPQALPIYVRNRVTG